MRRLRRLAGSTAAADGALALLVLANELPDFLTSAGDGLDTGRHLDPPLLRLPLGAAACVLILQCLLLAARRRRPVLVLLAVAAAAVILVLSGLEDLGNLSIPVMIAGYTVGAHCRLRGWAGASLLAVVAALGLLPFVLTGKVLMSVGHTVVLTGPVIVGVVMRRQRDTVGRLSARAEALTAERVQLSREVHDVVAQGISVIAVHAAGAERRFDAEPERAKQSLRVIGTSARDALSEMQLFVRTLRGTSGHGDVDTGDVDTGDDDTGDDDTGDGTVPGLERLPALVQRFRDAGVHVDIGSEVDQRLLDGVPTLTSRTAYRAVQEGLTNALKHAPGADVRIGVRTDGQELVVSVADDGGGSPGHAVQGAAPSAVHGVVPGAGPATVGPVDRAAAAASAALGALAGPGVPGVPGGLGLLGLRERVELSGGALRLERRPAGGHELVARLPLAAAHGPTR